MTVKFDIITRKQALEWSSKCEPMAWKKHNLTVVRDGCDPWVGTRIHFVKEEGYTGQIIGNAYVFTVK